ncbi:ABC transporter permease [Candidatus Bipolaricaulota bacterium]|nr:ABC transporter permease [Candidatus Bipolaricaulota bacterium]
MRKIKDFGWSVGRTTLTWKALSSFISLIVVLAFFYWQVGDILFNKSIVRGSILDLGVNWAIVALPVAMLMISGEFDLSVGSVFALGASGIFKLFQIGLHPLLAFVIILAACALIGFVHASITIKLGIPSFITTLAGMWFWRSVVNAMWSYTPSAPRSAIEYFNNVFGVRMAGGWFYSKFLFLIAIFVILWIVLERTPFGNSIFAAGGNYDAALARGSKPDRTKLVLFILTSTLAGFAGVVSATSAGATMTNTAMGLELYMIAAAVIGGAALTGGVGSLEGAFIGTFLLRYINTGVIQMGIQSKWFQGIIGVVLLLAAVLNRNFRSRVIKRFT